MNKTQNITKHVPTTVEGRWVAFAEGTLSQLGYQKDKSRILKDEKQKPDFYLRQPREAFEAKKIGSANIELGHGHGLHEHAKCKLTNHLAECSPQGKQHLASPHK